MSPASDDEYTFAGPGDDGDASGPEPTMRLRARSAELEVEARNALLEGIRAAATMTDPEYGAADLRVLAEAWALLAAPSRALTPPAEPGS